MAPRPPALVLVFGLVLGQWSAPPAHGEIPSVPGEVIESDVVGLVLVDLGRLETMVWRESVRRFFGETGVTSMDGPLKRIERATEEATATGAEAAALLLIADEPNRPPRDMRLILATPDDADTSPMRELLIEEARARRAGVRGADDHDGADSTHIARHGAWLVVTRPAGASVDADPELERRRARLIEAIDAAGPTPLRLALSVTDLMRKSIVDPMDPFEQAMHDLQHAPWFSGGMTPGSTDQVQFTLRLEDADAASNFMSFYEMIKEQPVALIGAGPGARMDFGRQVVSMLRLRQQGPFIIIDVDSTQAPKLAATVEPALKEARVEAVRVMSMNNMKQTLLAVHMFASDNDGAWPDSLEELIAAGHITEETLINPITGRKRGYLYVRPETPLDELEDPSITPVLWEIGAHEDSEVAVAFADGHVERRPQKDPNR